MVFKIQTDYPKGSIVFDVEFFETKMDSQDNLWHSEMRITTVPDGLIDLIVRVKESGYFNRQELKEDCKNVTSLWWWLWKQTEYGYNDYTTMDKSEHRHYHEFLPHVKEVLKEFCDKYNLYLIED